MVVGQANRDNNSVNVEILFGNYNSEVTCSDTYFCKYVNAEQYVDSVPILYGSSVGIIENVDEYGDIEYTTLCYELINYQFVLVEPDSIQKFFELRMVDFILNSKDKGTIKWVSIKLLIYSNPWFINEISYSEKGDESKQLKDFIDKGIVKDGGYLNFIIRFEDKGKLKKIVVAFKLIGTHDDKVYKKYLEYVELNKIITKDKFPDCVDPWLP